MSTEPPIGLSGAVAVVTGAAGDIGTAITYRLARERVTLVLADRDLPKDASKRTERLLSGGASDVRWVAGDVRDAGSCQGIVDLVQDEYGGLDLLINNAGINPFTQRPTHRSTNGRPSSIRISPEHYGCARRHSLSCAGPAVPPL
jgi:NAD(P)-dependent dehydrogenase (short-subunit alcohol dehydrogenase family)